MKNSNILNTDNGLWDMPFLPPFPSRIEGVESPTEILSDRAGGEWQFLCSRIADVPSPYDTLQDYNFYKAGTSEWKDVIVPASLTMQGFDIQNNVEYYYRRKITIGKNTKDLRTFVRFEGVYCNCRVWAANRYITTHIGGFTPFVIEITDYIGSDNSCDIVVGISDIEGENKGIWNVSGKPVSDASWGSYYAHNNICGILRGVTLFYLPDSFILSNRISSGLTNGYADGDLKMRVMLVGTERMLIRVRLEDSDKHQIYDETVEVGEEFKTDVSKYASGTSIDFDNFDYTNISARKSDKEYSEDYVRFNRCELRGDLYEISIGAVLPGIKAWTAEKPQLYRLTVALIKDGREICGYDENVGFRQIEYGGGDKDANKVYVNGSQVKLRGVCRHDISHKYGRSLSEEEELEEILSFKRNNINHVRTSHYPASKHYIELCDRYGLYVELENAVCFKGSNGYRMHCSAEQILQNLSEVIEFYHNNPSVLIWSIANESGFEQSCAFRKSYEYIKRQDISRPVIFSYPFTVTSKPLPYDIYSKHYHKVITDTGLENLPKLHDEFAHVSCYNLADLTHDNNFRIAWGESIRKGWERVYYDDGALGCAIWGGIDDVFYLPKPVSAVHQRHTASQAVGYGEWGAVLDVFKREKPEAYLTKKAFSPIIVDKIGISDGKAVLSVRNRYDHTNLKDVECKVFALGKTVYNETMTDYDIPPRTSGKIELPVGTAADTLDIAFYFGGFEVDRETVSAGGSKRSGDNGLRGSIEYEIRISDDKADAVIYAKGKQIAAGPYLYINSVKQKAVSRKIRIKESGGNKRYIFTDSYGYRGAAVIMLNDDGNGCVSVSLRCNTLLKTLIGNNFGVGFALDNGILSVDWRKDTLYSYYPPEHLERKEGRAYRRTIKTNRYGVKPDNAWKDDVRDYFYDDDNNGDSDRYCTNDFMTTRTNIIDYGVNYKDRKLLVTADGKELNCITKYGAAGGYVDCKSAALHKTGKWKTIHRNDSKCCMLSVKKGSSVSYNFCGSGVKIYGTRSKEQGVIRIDVDGKTIRSVSTRSDICDVLDFMTLDTIDGLANGRHTLTIELEDDKGVRISGFETIGGDGDTKTAAALYLSRGHYYKSLGWGNWCGRRLTFKERGDLRFNLRICPVDTDVE